METTLSGPLAGIRVIDLTTIVMGPYATQILGDLGADVIKVECPAGDIFRDVAPFRHRGMGAAFLNVNRNKRSVVLNLELDEDKQIMLKLLAAADVFVYTLRPRSLEKLGLDYNSLRELNPRLIHCGAYGFSEEGPYRGRPAYDDVIQAMSGTAALEGRNDPDGPKFVNTIMADKIAGLSAAYAIASALYERERSGLGQAIEVPMFETLVSFNMIEHLAGETFCPALGGMGYDRVLSAHRGPYRTKDGYIGLMPYSTAQWQRFFEIAGKPQYAADVRFTEHAARSENIDELYRILAEILVERSTAEWTRLLEAADIPMAAVLSPEDLLQDEHLQAVGFFCRDVHPSEGEIRTVSSPVRFSRTPGSIGRFAPRLNEHRDEILEEIGVRYEPEAAP
jgi:crotonobetainyl-CoA:carnitine CoA-transferase CaiB-like acyl-CoA transferase